MTYLERYCAGEREEVWVELLSSGGAVRVAPLLVDASAVAQETMRRARDNIAVIVARLIQSGYVFADLDSLGGPLDPPRPEIGEMIDDLERLVGTIPLALRAWYEIGGAVNLVGSHSTWPPRTVALSDPLVIAPPAVARQVCAQWLDAMRPGDGSDPPDILVGGNRLYKAGYSGGPAYTMEAPNPAVDGPLRGWYREATLVGYLRICFAWGGFPGFALYEDRPTEMLAYLAEGLQPL